jgi:hypothetical protein
MTNTDRLISIASDALAPAPSAMPELLCQYRLGSELFSMLAKKNGFYAFETALHVLPVTSDPGSGLAGWNSQALWRSGYLDLAEHLFFFAEDIFQDQFCFSPKHDGVLRFHAETGEATLMADSLEEWAGGVLSNYEVETGWPLAHEWQAKNGPLSLGKRLMPKIPFFLGGEYKIDNLWAGDPIKGMRFKADLAIQTRDLPEGARVKLRVTPKPHSTF